jgi:hypothetical protein
VKIAGATLKNEGSLYLWLKEIMSDEHPIFTRNPHAYAVVDWILSCDSVTKAKQIIASLSIGLSAAANEKLIKTFCNITARKVRQESSVKLSVNAKKAGGTVGVPDGSPDSRVIDFMAIVDTCHDFLKYTKDVTRLMAEATCLAATLTLQTMVLNMI